MKEIKLTQGKVALVDDEDFEYLMQWRWFAVKSKNTFYPVRCLWVNKSCRHLSMYNVIMNPEEGMRVDHVDRNGLNCQKFNLRICTLTQNNLNKSPYGKSMYKGVYFEYHKDVVYICAQIISNGKKYYLGRFKTEEAAGRKYDEMAKQLHGEFAYLNFVI